jgi:hypothetical protein
MVLRPWAYGLLALEGAAIFRVGVERNYWGEILLGLATVGACLWMLVGSVEHWSKRL